MRVKVDTSKPNSMHHFSKWGVENVERVTSEGDCFISVSSSPHNSKNMAINDVRF